MYSGYFYFNSETENKFWKPLIERFGSQAAYYSWDKYAMRIGDPPIYVPGPRFRELVENGDALEVLPSFEDRWIVEEIADKLGIKISC